MVRLVVVSGWGEIRVECLVGFWMGVGWFWGAGEEGGEMRVE